MCSEQGPVDAVEVFTTRIDTIHGVSFLAISHENLEVLDKLKTASPAFSCALEGYLLELDQKKQQGFSTVSVDINNIDPGVRVPGLHAINPINGATLPIYITSYVRADYGPGAIMGVPAHDERDYAFAQKHSLPVLKVVDCETQTLISSGSATGLSIKDAQKQILEELGQETAHETTEYRLRDWTISRQRYWGVPIPVTFDQEGQAHAETALPLQLPRIKDSESLKKCQPLSHIEEFVSTQEGH